MAQQKRKNLRVMSWWAANFDSGKGQICPASVGFRNSRNSRSGCLLGISFKFSRNRCKLALSWPQYPLFCAAHLAQDLRYKYTINYSKYYIYNVIQAHRCHSDSLADSISRHICSDNVLFLRVLEKGPKFPSAVVVGDALGMLQAKCKMSLTR